MSDELTTNYLLLELSLYNEKTIDNLKLIHSLTSECNITQFDSFCVSCKRESLFKKIVTPRSPVHSGIRFKSMEVVEETDEEIRYNQIQGEHVLSFECQRENKHLYSFYFKVTDRKIIKIGQYPSIADLGLHKIEKYRPLLNKEYKNFSKAIGLFSHGVGAGSYVYLRRIFENLIIEQKEIALKSDSSLCETVFAKKRMDEKILYIKDFLPEILVKNRNIYAILSKGIHELSEAECLSLFPKLVLGIEIILDWKLAEKEKLEKEKQLSDFVSETVGKLK